METDENCVYAGDLKCSTCRDPIAMEPVYFMDGEQEMAYQVPICENCDHYCILAVIPELEDRPLAFNEPDFRIGGS